MVASGGIGFGHGHHGHGGEEASHMVPELQRLANEQAALLADKVRESYVATAL